jgi:hypothetical protein
MKKNFFQAIFFRVHRQQVADETRRMSDDIAEVIYKDLDPSDQLANTACYVCGELGEFDATGVMLLCDYKSSSMSKACDRPTHLFCAGLTAKPAGKWYGPCCVDLVLTKEDEQVRNFMLDNNLNYTKGMTMADATDAVKAKTARQLAARQKVDADNRNAAPRANGTSSRFSDLSGGKRKMSDRFAELEECKGFLSEAEYDSKRAALIAML